jgi:hypothetical protein
LYISKTIGGSHGQLLLAFSNVGVLMNPGPSPNTPNIQGLNSSQAVTFNNYSTNIPYLTINEFKAL